MILGMEGADAITWPEQVHDWYADGLRVISLSHYGVSYYSHGTGTGTTGGLTPMAKPLLQAMSDLGMILDVTHTSDQSVREEFELFDGPCPGESPELPRPRPGRAPAAGRHPAGSHPSRRRDRFVHGYLDAQQVLLHRLEDHRPQGDVTCFPVL